MAEQGNPGSTLVGFIGGATLGAAIGGTFGTIIGAICGVILVNQKKLRQFLQKSWQTIQLLLKGKDT